MWMQISLNAIVVVVWIDIQIVFMTNRVIHIFLWSSFVIFHIFGCVLLILFCMSKVKQIHIIDRSELIHSLRIYCILLTISPDGLYILHRISTSFSHLSRGGTAQERFEDCTDHSTYAHDRIAITHVEIQEEVLIEFYFVNKSRKIGHIRLSENVHSRIARESFSDIVSSRSVSYLVLLHVHSQISCIQCLLYTFLFLFFFLVVTHQFDLWIISVQFI